MKCSMDNCYQALGHPGDHSPFDSPAPEAAQMKHRKKVMGKFKTITNQEAKHIIDELKTPQEISMTPAPRCECHIIFVHNPLSGSEGDPEIVFCPTHANAFAMKEALKCIAVYGVWKEENTIDSIEIMRIAAKALRWTKETP